MREAQNTPFEKGGHAVSAEGFFSRKNPSAALRHLPFTKGDNFVAIE
jgi:hypothetical protein